MTCTNSHHIFAAPLWRSTIGSLRPTGDLQVWRDEVDMTLLVQDLRRLLRLGLQQESSCWTSICQLVYSSRAEETDHRNSPDKAEMSLENLLGAAEEPPPQMSYGRTERMCNNEEKEEVIQVRKENTLLLSQFSTPENRSEQLSP